MHEKTGKALTDMIEGLPALHARGHGVPEVRVAILDGPADLSHPVFRGSLIKDFGGSVSGKFPASLDTAHGTAVASLLFGQPGSALEGMAPGCQGLLVPIFSQDERGKILPCSQLELARAILLAVSAGAHLINISGGQLFVPDAIESLLERAIDECRRREVLIIAAAGNDGCACTHLPSALPWVLAVGATDREGVPIAESNWGESYKDHGIVAPGKNIPVALSNGGLGSLTGTSVAAPIVTGVAALLLSLQYSESLAVDPTFIRQALLNTARHCPDHGSVDCQHYLGGALDVAGAWQYVKRHLESAQRKSLTATLSYKGITMSTAVPQPADQIQQPPSDVPSLPARFAIADDVAQSHAAISPSLCQECEHEAATRTAVPTVQPSPTKVYMLGTIGYDFASESRYYSVAQSSGVQNPGRIEDFLPYLKDNQHIADSVVWTIKMDDAAIYALHPSGAYAPSIHGRLIEFLQAQVDGAIQRVSIPGIAPGATVRTRSGHVLPILTPDIRGMYAWSTDALVASVCGARPTDEVEQASYEKKRRRVYQFLDRVYHELRGFGVTPQERALNFAVTNAYQVEKVFENALSESMELYKIDVEKSPVQRPGADCWDVKLTFFAPEKRLEKANVEYRITVDVGDVVPATVGPIRTWSTY
jgi:cyanobactin maturation PatA/PatG family protease